MTKARIFISLLSILCFSQPALSQRSQTGGGKTDVYIYVEFEDQSPAAQAYKVQLLSSTRLQVAMMLTSNEDGTLALEFRRVPYNMDALLARLI